MNTTFRRGKVAAIAAASTVLVAGVTACGSSSDNSGGSGTATTGGNGSALAAEVAKLEKPLDKYPVPTAPISNVASLKGKTVYYVPITMQSPQFKVTLASVTAAFKTVGVNVQSCDGKGTPTDVAACITQATDQKAAAIITDAIPYVIAANAFDAAQKAGIPVVISNQVSSDDAHPASKTLAYIPAGGSGMQEALAKWVTVDSGAKANILINQGTDGPAPAVFVAAGQAVYKSQCPNCVVTINKVSSANFSLIPSSTSSALLKNPNVNYVESQFEQYLQPTQTGVQQAGRTSDVKGLTGSVQLGGLQQLKSKNFLYAAAGQASSFQGWVDADAVMRLVLGDELPSYTIPVRLFTRDTVNSITLSSAAEESGEWYGPTTFTEDFKKLWGVS
ncbi:monosaccharide ABC transporter substrate-binding protein (CUT2 family) [Branchiibius hedensis]|uniref:Monosaccharide ABC transporter substrate-binding protein, CUT2 family n=1 Tax=Branchiibius hedensis TaxID=672460 RepID=A0A2Y8ZTB9_9MICO|nr:substrate-binding domain-containing protein [Branchiibius hedensis]PWJ26820.1 monosaccharide ABC transporter substrate-binding protein (CUT2 family) [Branchiibius hedensis]SSA35631.1 monosaccharide ABC transporter substrate-binding protein, CUT2 family [Branchiibius hedensis]